MKSCVLSVVYPQALEFLDDFLGSLIKQTDKDFDLLLVNDGVAHLEKRCESAKLRVHVKRASGKPASLRKAGIAWALEMGYETVIFADADDTFSVTRVGVSKAAVKEKGFVFNELILFGAGLSGQTSMLGARLAEGAQIAENDLLDKNCLGLSNTALAANRLVGVFEEVPDDIIAYDWALFSKVLHRGAQATFTAKTCTHYRRYEQNLAGLPPLSDESILHGVRVKTLHYASLATLGTDYLKLASEFKVLEEKLKKDVMFRKIYCDAVKTILPKNVWWLESIKKEEELGL